MTLVDRMERISEDLAHEIVKRQAILDRAIGDRKFGQEKLTEAEQVQRYALVRDNPQAWRDLINQHGYKSTMDYAERNERLKERYPDEFASVPKALPPLTAGPDQPTTEHGGQQQAAPPQNAQPPKQLPIHGSPPVGSGG